jgi:hypothetical protein
MPPPMIRLLDMTVVPQSTCWHCGMSSDRSSGLGATPLTGDWALCIGCGALSVYTADLTLRRPTDDEKATASRDPNVSRFREALARAKGQLAPTSRTTQ